MNILKYFKESSKDARLNFYNACADTGGNLNLNSLIKSIDGSWWPVIGLNNKKLKFNKIKEFIENNPNDFVVTHYDISGMFSGYYFADNMYIYISTNLSKTFRDEITCYTRSIEFVPLIEEFISKNFTEIPKKSESYIHLLQYSQQDGYSLSEYEIKEIKDLDLGLNYNDGFADVHDKLIDTIKTQEKSMTILHGEPGCGKTTYLRYLIAVLATASTDTKVVYLPPNMTQVLSNPDFISSLDLFRNSVVIIEDAEGVLTKEGKRSQAISNILNITDGILADLFNIHFVFTFNIDIKDIDPALLRKGRLTHKYEFKKLEALKVKHLCNKIGVDMSEDATLADIYNSDDNGVNKKENKKIGY